MADSRTSHAGRPTEYDVAGLFIERVYGANIHYGYWDADDGDRSFADAQDRLTDVLGGLAGVGPGSSVLDIGCGTGGTARRLRRSTGAEVTGVTLGQWEVDLARRKAADDGDTGLRFERADAVELPFPDGAFDAAFIVEVLVHVPDKAAALSEVRRVLRRGGRLVCAEPVKARAMSALQTVAWYSMGMASVPDEDSYRQVLQAAGLELERVEDATANIRPSFSAIRRAAREAFERLRDEHPGAELAQARRMMLEAQEIVERSHGYRIFVASAP